ncbi:MAG: sel1 repeat family protein [Nitrospira sp. LK70]|nr:sel1 repeat family protein [Nitrospira sp. LK70]
MAKKGYPGLVLVPPSDRTILRRRLLRWALLIVALIWGVSTLPLWPSASNDNANCPPGAGEQASGKSPEQCGQPQSATEPPVSQSEFNLTPLSQAEGLVRLENPPPSLASDPDRLPTQNDRDLDSQPKSSGYADHTSGHNVTPPSGNEKSTTNLPTTKSTHNPDVDIRRAERGDAFAQYRLGRYYARRSGSQTPESVSWYKKASPGLHRLAETGNGEAMYVLGVMYAYGRGVAQDTGQARHWLAQAIERKITAAEPVLANLQVQPGANPRSKRNGEGKR